jgi:PII-like signaling protein
MIFSEQGKLLRIYVGELDTYDGKPLYQWLVEEARERGLAGATALRGLEGYGAHNRVHTAKVMRLSVDLPVVIEIVDTEEKIDAFLPVIDDVIPEGLATVERVQIRLYRSAEE